MKKISLAICFSLIILPHLIFGCSLRPNYLSKFDKTEYIFIGEVIGYTNPIKFERKFLVIDENSAWHYKQTQGLIVKVKEFVNLPKIPRTHFEVFPFGLGGGCETLGVHISELKKDYPINSEILVVVKEATIFPHILANGNFRLEYKFARSNLIASNKNKNNQPLTDATSIYNFSKIETIADFEDNYRLFDFEARKDLKRVQDSKAQIEKEEEIINRLIKNPTLSIDFFELLKLNIKSKQEVLQLYETRLRFENNFFTKIYGQPIYADQDIQDYLTRAKKKLEEIPKKNLNDRKPRKLR